ncbi:hypothetical protein MNBD_NITROSPIRAE03-1618 [hydrothermal vent metagenome]|uniref:Uncharacterized protein n=1 Tax=hydrothermal vent metagenome TaxID=652676 RepID=A0A3B1DDF3_9ZZZZ
MGSIKRFIETSLKCPLKKAKKDKLPRIVYKRNFRGTTLGSPSDFLISYSKPFLNPELNNNKK